MSCAEYSNYLNAVNGLYEELFTTRIYNKILSPIYERMPEDFEKSSTPRFNVKIDLTYLKIFSLDAETQVMSSCLETILKIWVNIDAVWVPENEIGNSRALDLVYPDNTRTVVVHADGTIRMANIYYSEVSCTMNVSIFPFDRQMCEIGYMAFSYEWKYISMTGQNLFFDYDYAGNGEWKVTNVSVDRYHYGPDGPYRMDVLAFHIHLSRVPHFYIYVIAVPCFILTLLGVVGMFWTPNVVEEQLAKLSIGLTSLVSITVLLDMVSQAIPKTEQFPLLGIYVVVSVVITSVACVVVVGCTTKHKEKEENVTRMFKNVECKKERSTCSKLFDLLTSQHVFFQILFQIFVVKSAAQTIDYTRFGGNAIYSDFLNNSTKLYNEIFTTRNYNKNQSPVFERMPDNFTESPVSRFNVNILLWYLRIFELDAQSQILSLCIEVIFTWQDLRLAWDPQDYAGIEQMWTNVDSVWFPENEIGDAKNLQLVHPDQQRTVQISYNGTVRAPFLYYAETSCNVRVATFPFDHQICQVAFMVFTYGYKYVSMSGDIYEKLVPQSNGEWEIINVTVETSTYGAGAEMMDLLAFTIRMNRVPHYYIYVIAIPCFILTLLSIIGMFWTPNCREEQIAKLSIGLTSLISMTVLIDMVSGAIPKTSTFPLLGIYVVVCVGITAFASVFVVAFCQERREMEKCAKMTDDFFFNLRSVE
ncbi:unnamed protein product, partial [Mesorhabditis belari]|uniref:Uncharacterized protein n=1 Tax=Mesorhabditis belari TaxID=2138241 RepID=A0AAF3FTL3_9BILA